MGPRALGGRCRTWRLLWSRGDEEMRVGDEGDSLWALDLRL